MLDSDKVLVSSRTSDQIYAIDPKTLTWKWWQTGYRIRPDSRRRATACWRPRCMTACWSEPDARPGRETRPEE